MSVSVVMGFLGKEQVLDCWIVLVWMEAARDSATENPGSEVAATTFKTDLLIVVSGDMPKRPMCCNHPAISPLTV